MKRGGARAQHNAWPGLPWRGVNGRSPQWVISKGSAHLQHTCRPGPFLRSSRLFFFFCSLQGRTGGGGGEMRIVPQVTKKGKNN